MKTYTPATWHSNASLSRGRLESCFSPETANPGTAAGRPASAGHCAVVSVLFCLQWGEAARPVSATVNGESHWFVRVLCDDGSAQDMDLTADQWCRPDKVLAAPAGNLYPGTRERKFDELNAETIGRAIILAGRVGWEHLVPTLVGWLVEEAGKN